MPDHIFVMCFSTDLSKLVTLTQLHGPEFWRNKLSFPSGQPLPGELPEVTASRVLLEKTGLLVASAEMDFPILYRKTRHWLMQVYLCQVPDDLIRTAQSLTDEPVRVQAPAELLLAAWKDPAIFCLDFMELMAMAREAALPQ